MNFWSHAPIVRRAPLKMVQLVTIGTERRVEPFEHEVLWLRKSESQVRLMHRGVEVDDAGAYCDGRLGSSVTSAIESAISTAKRLKIHEGPTELHVEVLARLYDSPALEPSADKPRHLSVPEYRSLPDGWLLPEPITEGEFTWHPRVEAVDVEPWSLVWTSAKHNLTETEPARIVELIERWRREAEALAAEAEK